MKFSEKHLVAITSSQVMSLWDIVPGGGVSRKWRWSDRRSAGKGVMPERRRSPQRSPGSRSSSDTPSARRINLKGHVASSSCSVTSLHLPTHLHHLSCVYLWSFQDRCSAGSRRRFLHSDRPNAHCRTRLLMVKDHRSPISSSITWGASYSAPLCTCAAGPASSPGVSR